jgi:putative copper resistance protein D
VARVQPARVAVTVTLLAVLSTVVAQLTMTADLAGREPAELFASALRVLGYVAASGTVGSLVLVLLTNPSEGRADDPRTAALTFSASVWATLWAASSVATAVTTLVRSERASTVLHAPSSGSSALDGVVVASVLTALAAGVVAALTHSGRTGRVPAAYLLALGALAGLVLTGHSAGADNWGWALLSLALHVGAVTLWFGGLLALVTQVAVEAPTAAQLRQFSSVALGAFVAVVLSGVVNVRSRMSLAELLDSGAYVFLLGAKIGLLVLLGLAGLAHRTRSIRRVEQGNPHAFWLLVAGELVLLAVATGLAVVLARTGF